MRKPVLLRGLTILLAGALAMPSCIKVGGKPLNEGNAEKRDISSPGSPPSIGALHLSSNVLTIIGDNLQEVSRVRLEGAASRELQVISATPNSLLVAASSPLALALGAAYQLVISNAHGDDTVPFSFNIASGNLTESGSSVLTITGGAGAVLGSGTTIQVKQANASQPGFLSAADWSAFNGKEPAITAGTSAQYLKGDKTLGTFGTDVLSAISGNVSEGTLSLSDVATGDASTARHGFLPKLPGGTTNFLREDGTWAAPPASANLTTATDFGTAAAGAVTLGTAGQNTVLNGNVEIGTSAPNAGLHIATNGSASNSAPAVRVDGAWAADGTATSTKPQILVEPAGTQSDGWSTLGTGLGVNAASGFAGILIDAQVDGLTRFRVGSTGNLITTGTISTYGSFYAGNGTASWPSFTFGSNNTTGFYLPAANAIGYTSGGAERLRIDPSGNVGIGTNAPTSRLDVTTSSGSAISAYSASSTGLFVRSGSGTGIQGHSGFNSSAYFASLTADNALPTVVISRHSAAATADLVRVQAEGGTPLMTVTSTGAISIGPAAPKATLDVDGYARLKSHSSAPVACDPAHGGSIALTSTYGMCVCNGADWVLVNTATLCTW